MQLLRILIGFIVTLFFPLAAMGKDNQISISYSNSAGNTDYTSKPYEREE